MDELMGVGGVDAVLIGPHDLSCSIGLPEKYDHPEFLKATEKIITKARSHGIGAGLHFWGTNDDHVRFLDMGANFLIHKADAIYFRTGLKKEISEIREKMGDSIHELNEGETAI